MMQILPTRIHGMLDYGMGLLLIAAPYLFGFANGGIEQWLPMLLGASVIAYSLLTDYEFSAFRFIPMPVHLGLDFGGGLLLAASPWLFGFSETVYLPHLTFGLIEMGTALLTKTKPSRQNAFGPSG